MGSIFRVLKGSRAVNVGGLSNHPPLSSPRTTKLQLEVGDFSVSIVVSPLACFIHIWFRDVLRPLFQLSSTL